MHARILRLTSATNAHLFPCFARALPIRPSLQVAASRRGPRGLRGPRGQLAEARLFGQIFARLALPPSSLPVSHSCHESRNFLLWNGIRWAERKGEIRKEGRMTPNFHFSLSCFLYATSQVKIMIGPVYLFLDPLGALGMCCPFHVFQRISVGDLSPRRNQIIAR